MIATRRRPPSVRTIRSAFSDQVPPVIEAYILLLIAQAKERIDEMEVDAYIRSIRDGIRIEHLPDRRAFEQAFLSKRAFPAEVKIDERTDRIYLAGVGLPGREELRLHRIRRVDPQLGRVDELVTTGEEHHDVVISYTEVSWAEYRQAHARLHALDEDVRSGLAAYFQLPAFALLGLLLATPTLTDEDLHRIAAYAHSA